MADDMKSLLSKSVYKDVPWEEYAKINSKLIKRLELKLFIDTRRFLSFNNDGIKFLSLGIGPKNFNLQA